jgi:hypothetical protein
LTCEDVLLAGTYLLPKAFLPEFHRGHPKDEVPVLRITRNFATSSACPDRWRTVAGTDRFAGNDDPKVGEAA